MAESRDVKLPYIGYKTAQYMAVAAFAVLEGVADVYDTLVENGEVKE